MHRFFKEKIILKKQAGAEIHVAGEMSTELKQVKINDYSS